MNEDIILEEVQKDMMLEEVQSGAIDLPVLVGRLEGIRQTLLEAIKARGGEPRGTTPEELLPELIQVMREQPWSDLDVEVSDVFGPVPEGRGPVVTDPVGSDIGAPARGGER